MKKLKIILAAVLIASIFTVSGTNSIWADNLFSGFFKSTEKERSNSANSGDLIVVLDAGHGGRDSGHEGEEALRGTSQRGGYDHQRRHPADH